MGHRTLSQFELSERRKLLIAGLVIFAVALALRLVYLSQWLDLPLSKFQLIDSAVYERWATAIAEGKDFGGPAFYLSPLYPYTVGLIFKILGHHLEGVFLLQSIASALTAVVAYRIGLMLFGFWPGVVAGGLCALYRPYIFYSALLMKETFGMFLIALFIWSLVSTLRRPSHAKYFVTGILLGLNALSRGNVLFWGPALVAWLAWRRPGGTIKAAVFSSAFLTLGTVFALSPATIHNYLKSKDFVLITYAGGFNFYLGNRGDATGFDNYPPDISAYPEQEEIDTTTKAEVLTGRKLSPSEVSSFWFDRGYDFMRADFPAWVKIQVIKLYAFWNRFEPFDNYNLEFTSKNFSTVLRSPLVSFALVSVLGMFGLALFGFRDDTTKVLALLIMVYLLSVVMFVITDRYRLPVPMLLFPFAGTGAVRAIEAWRKKEWALFKRPVLIAAPFLVAAVAPPIFPSGAADADGWSFMSSINYKLGNYQDSFESFQKSIEASTRWTKPKAYLTAALSLEELKRMDEADSLFQRAVQAYPNKVEIVNGYGGFLLRQGRYNQAQGLFEHCLSLKPRFEPAHQNLCLLHVVQGHPEIAKKYCRASLALDPGDKDLLHFLHVYKVDLAATDSGDSP